MMRAEENLSTAVVISIISNRPSVQGEEITGLVALWLEEEPSSLVPRCMRPSVFLVFPPHLGQV
jgi:hypothetical protein